MAGFLFRVLSRMAGGGSNPRAVRTVCRFSGGSRHITAEERERHWHEGHVALGEGVLVALRSELEALGVTVTALGPETHGYSARVRAGDESARVRVVSTTEEPDIWELHVLNPRLRRNGESSLMERLDRALRSLSDLTGVEWEP